MGRERRWWNEKAVFSLSSYRSGSRDHFKELTVFVHNLPGKLIITGYRVLP